MSANVFIITSTVNTALGLISVQDRFIQTLETIKSIRSRVPNSVIVMVDNSSQSLDHQAMDYLASQVDHFLYIGWRRVCQTFNRFGIKGAGESYMLLVGLDFVQSRQLSAERIFKISGRYRLTERFNIEDYKQCHEKFCFKTRGQNFLHSRLWSGCGTRLNDMIELTKKSLNTHLQLNITIEEAIYKEIDFDRLVEFDEIHCEGYIAPWNKLIQD